MGIQMMVFTYLLGRTDAERPKCHRDVGRQAIGRARLQASVLSIVAVVVIGNVLYGAVFAPHLVTKLGGWVTSGPTTQHFPGVPNQPR